LAVSQILGSLWYNRELLRTIFGEEGKMIESPFLQELEVKWSRRTMQNVILNVLRDRFGAVPEDVAAGIRATGEDQNTRLVQFASRCESLVQFREALGGS
jgi:hypothetical protein